MILQRTPEWFIVKQGKVSASDAYKLMRGPSTRDLYMAEKGAERMTHLTGDHAKVNSHIERGISLEPEAIREYERRTESLILDGYWVEKGTWGCTPDAFVDDDGLLSIKCPLAKNVARISLFPDKYAADQKFFEYYWQAMTEMAATERQWCDLALYCREIIEPEHQLYIQRIERNEDDVARIIDAIAAFNDELEQRLTRIGISWTFRTEDTLYNAPIPGYPDLERYLLA